MSQPPADAPDFNAFGIDERIKRALSEEGLITPTPIQQQAIPPATKGRDIVGIAQTGTGKTAAFALPVITRLLKGRTRARMPRCIILTPTRELAAQVDDHIKRYTRHCRLSIALLIGGVSYAKQDALLLRGVDILIATPGRLLDHVDKGRVILSGIEMLVIDEADRMLDMGFIPDVDKILSFTPITRQVLLFSATMPEEITALIGRYLHRPLRFDVTPHSSPAETVEQFILRLPNRQDRLKHRVLDTLLRKNCDQGIVFCNRKRTVDEVVRALRPRHKVRGIHGDMTQSLRIETLQAFRDGGVTTLVASDVAARGLDIADVAYVVNYDVPLSREDYVHRIGRTGRAGRKGCAYMLATPADLELTEAIDTLSDKALRELPLQDFTARLDTKLLSGEKDAPQENTNKTAGSEKKGRRRRSKKKLAKKSATAPEQAAPVQKHNRRSSDQGNENKTPDGESQPTVKKKESPKNEGMVHVPAFLKRPTDLS